PEPEPVECGGGGGVRGVAAGGVHGRRMKERPSRCTETAAIVSSAAPVSERNLQACSDAVDVELVAQRGTHVGKLRIADTDADALVDQPGKADAKEDRGAALRIGLREIGRASCRDRGWK